MSESRAALTLRLSQTARDRLQDIADAKGVSVSDIIRLAIARFDEEERRRSADLQAA